MVKRSKKADSWNPPLNYNQVGSAVEGITVYAPTVEQASQQIEEPTSFKCPNCGANTKYDVAAGGIACEYCGYIGKTKVEKVGARADTFEFTLTTLSEAEQGWGVILRELHCDSCGADLAVEENALTSTCPFCSSNRVILRQPPSDNLRPRYLIPFKIQPDQCHNLAKEWLGTRWFHPSDLSQSTIIERFRGIYISFWTFSAKITSLWKAQVGYQRSESYFDGGKRKTRTVIDWRWEKGKSSISILDLLVCGSSNIKPGLIEQMQSYNLSDLVDYSPQFLAGWQAQTYDISLPKAWEIGKSKMREKAKQSCFAQIKTHLVRNFTMSADYEEESWRYILLPVYIAAYNFDAKTYQVIINGQTGEVVGQKPVAWWKIWLAIAIMFLPGLACSLVGLLIFPLLPIGVLLLIAAGIFGLKLYQQAVNSEAAL